MYFVTAGAFHLIDDAAPDEILFTLRPGFFFGEMALLDATVRRTVSVVADWKQHRAAGSCQLMGLCKADFDRIAAAHPECLEAVRAAGKERLEFTLAEQASADKKAQ
jgi:CRP-like cAMP-binding protein